MSSLSEASLQPYLFFAGQCEEALDFYAAAIGAETLVKMRFSDSPVPLPDGVVQPGFEEKVMHATVKVGQMTFMASDGCPDKPKFDGFRLALTVRTETECEEVFHALADGGTIDLPLEATFWSPLYGQVTDRFGVGWMIMAAGSVPD